MSSSIMTLRIRSWQYSFALCSCWWESGLTSQTNSAPCRVHLYRSAARKQLLLLLYHPISTNLDELTAGSTETAPVAHLTTCPRRTGAGDTGALVPSDALRHQEKRRLSSYGDSNNSAFVPDISSSDKFSPALLPWN